MNLEQQLKLLQEIGHEKDLLRQAMEKHLFDELLERCRTDFVWFVENCLTIRNKSKVIIPFTPHAAQRRIIDTVMTMMKEEDRVAIQTLKCRQMGSSTIYSALMLWACMFPPFGEVTDAFLVAHNRSLAEEMLSLTKGVYERLPAGLPFIAGCEKSTPWNASKCHFTNGSKILTASGGSGEAGRSQSPNFVWATEVAFWTEDEKILRGLFEGMPQKSIAIIESTANGIGNTFERMWRNIEKKQGSYKGIFIPWYELEYGLTTEEQLERGINSGSVFTQPNYQWITCNREKYREIKEKYNLTWGQVHWMHDKIDDKGEDSFKQEYPSTSEEAFLSTGQSVFLEHHIRKIERDCSFTNIKFEGNLINSMTVAQHGGELVIWRYPEPRQTYFAGADCAGGGQKSDFSVIYIMDKDGKLCARLRGQYEPFVASQKYWQLCRMYYDARLTVERLQHGIAVIENLRNVLRYKKMWEDEKDNQIGYRPHQDRKIAMINRLREDLTNDVIDVPCLLFKEETGTFIEKTPGVFGTIIKHLQHDDCIMALGLTNMTRVRYTAQDARIIHTRPSYEESIFDDDYIPQRRLTNPKPHYYINNNNRR